MPDKRRLKKETAEGKNFPKTTYVCNRRKFLGEKLSL
jgi:hypothetical protein